ncbi:acetylornithine deacetylase [Ferrovibrio terrae]|uniref:acetylornithine deacetylase n=1 Tax=Ferrovibrio terrae TaxID=2594003 RepID=UPI003137C631
MIEKPAIGGMGGMPSAGALSLIGRLIGFPTVSRDSNLALIEWVRDYLAEYGVVSRLVYSDDRKKANLFATIGKSGDGGIVLSGHTDVVPVNPQDWDSDPFAAIIRDERIYGRGTADMKGFIGVVLSKIPALVSATRTKPVHLAFSYDEEVGCKGVPRLLSYLKEQNIRPDACLVGEPTLMQVVNGHKGSKAFRCRIVGRQVHSSLAPRGVNAVHYAARLIEHIRQIGLRLEKEERRHDGYDVPVSTVQTGFVAGGVATNMVPSECEFRFDIRHLPWTDPDALLAEIRTYAEKELLIEMRRVAQETDIFFEQLGEVPSLDEPEESPLSREIKHAAQHNDCAVVSFGTEAGLFQRAGIPAIVCGPGSIADAHKPNEFVALEQIALCERFLDRLLGLTEPQAAS